MHGWQAISNKFGEISIRYKFLFIIFISNILIVFLLSLIYSIVTERHREMLYNETASRLIYTSRELEYQLDTMKDLSRSIISSPEVQTHMNTLRTSTNYLEKKQASQELSAYLQKVQYEYPDDVVTFLSLQTPISSIDTHLASARKVSPHMRSSILQKAIAQNGIPRFVIDYGNEPGLILSRSIKQAAELSLVNLGAVLIGIDLKHLMNKTMESLEYSDDQAVILSANSSIFYHSDRLNSQTASAILLDMDSDYKLIPCNGRTYFAMKGKLSTYNWDYIYLLDYTNTQQFLRQIHLFVLLCTVFITSLILYFAHNAIGSILKHLDNLMQKIVCFRKQLPIKPLFAFDYAHRKDELGALHTQFDAMTNRINTLIEENYKKEILKQQAELQALRAQINPHFLYNTLNSINWSAKSIGADRISLMVESLGKILHTSLSNDAQSFTLGDAVELQQAYLTIQKIRYENRLEYEIQIPESYYYLPFPRMILQPLVENAVRYGVEENLDPTRIKISAKKIDSDICVTIQNSGSEFPDSLLEKLEDKTITPHGFGIGLLNIHKRLRYTYGDDYGLRLENIDDMATVHVTIPMKQEREDPNNAQTDHR